MDKTLPAPPKSPRGAWHYAGVEGHWDEALLPSGFPRRHWRKLCVALGRMTPAELSRSWQTGQQLIQANDISFGSDPLSQDRPWPVDPIPLLIADKEWTRIETAIAQRARLLNAMLHDLYGERRLLQKGYYPPELLYANPHFLRPCHGIGPQDGIYLHSYAADLARSPDGNWWIVADRTQVPSGLGYTLENRLVSSRTLPDIFSQYFVRPLLPFFDAKRDRLMALAASLRPNPRIVVLTSGPHNASYFERSFLAGHWGFPLVEGADLAVRDNRVYLKTLAGLDPVDLIVRRLEDSFCDPLELRDDSLLGVPGLLQAVRCGTVLVDNALGSGLVETAGQIAFLPGLARQLLSEELLIPSVATWWCGQEEARQYVLEHLDELAILPTFPRFGLYPEFPASMSCEEREELAARIKAQPEQFVAQERVAFSTAPVRTESGLAPRQVLLRAFAAWDGNEYRVLPGSLTRVSSEETSHFLSMQLGSGSKDAWVLCGPGDVRPTMRPLEVSPDAHSGRASLPSRVADNLFWLGRYAERVESSVRLMRALLPALSSEEEPQRAVSLETAVRLLVGLQYLPPDITNASLGQQMWFLQRLLSEVVYDRARTFGLGWNLREMRRVAWQLKERLSVDAWRVLQQIDSDFPQSAPLNPNERFAALNGLLDRAVVTLAAFAGLLMENTTRGPGWHFLEIGRRLERTVQTAELLRSSLTEAPAAEVEAHLQLLLRIADSAITYRAHYPTVLRSDLVLELLLVDESNPRSVGFQLAALLDLLEKLPDRAGRSLDLLERQQVLSGLAAVRSAKLSELCRPDALGRLTTLEELANRMISDMGVLSDALTARYLTHVTTSPVRSSL